MDLSAGVAAMVRFSSFPINKELIYCHLILVEDDLIYTEKSFLMAKTY